MLQFIFKIFKILNSDASVNQIASGLCMGMMLGLTPLFNVHNLIIIFIVCIVRVNITSVLLAWAIFTLFAYLLDPTFHFLGETMLLSDALSSLWTPLYSSDIWRLLKYNNTLIMGSVVFSLAAWLPMFFIFKKLISQYREKLIVWFEKTRFVKGFKASKWFQRAQFAYDVAGEA